MNPVRHRESLLSALLLAPVFVVVMVGFAVQDPAPRLDRPSVGLGSLAAGWLLVTYLGGPRFSSTAVGRLRRARVAFAAVTLPVAFAPLCLGLPRETLRFSAAWDALVLPIWQGAMMGLCVGAGIALRVASVEACAAAGMEAPPARRAPPSN